ncbi:MAG: hypothetical protein MK434_06450, partial [SAR324 cluster bacterium]|nr:hypothetical protein [SAR324 cluster bacterium]
DKIKECEERSKSTINRLAEHGITGRCEEELEVKEVLCTSCFAAWVKAYEKWVNIYCAAGEDLGD